MTNATPTPVAQEMVEVEIREAPRPSPVLAPSRFALWPESGITGAATVKGSNGTLDAVADVNGEGNANGFPDSASLSPNALFRAYLERERGVGGRNVSEEVRLRFSGGSAAVGTCVMALWLCRCASLRRRRGKEADA